jgi:hypothetical protein
MEYVLVSSGSVDPTPFWDECRCECDDVSQLMRYFTGYASSKLDEFSMKPTGHFLSIHKGRI